MYIDLCCFITCVDLCGHHHNQNTQLYDYHSNTPMLLLHTHVYPILPPAFYHRLLLASRLWILFQISSIFISGRPQRANRYERKSTDLSIFFRFTSYPKGSHDDFWISKILLGYLIILFYFLLNYFIKALESAGRFQIQAISWLWNQ